MKNCRHVFVVVVAAFITVSTSQAELPLIRLDRIFPLGAKAGTSCTLDIAGRDLDEAKELRFDHPGIKAEHVKERQFKVAVADDVPPGSYEARVVGKYGISGVRVFAVSRGLVDVADKEPNDTLEQAQKLPMNCAVNGNSDGNGDDFFRFSARKGQRLTIDCQAFRLDSRLRGILSVATAEGRELLQSKPYYTRTDPFLDFVAPADGDYIVGLHDMTFQGGLPYRLVISDHPHVENVFPAALTPGSKSQVTILGRNLPGSKALPEADGNGPGLEQLAVTVTAPAGPAAQHGFAFINHFTSPNLHARGFQLWPDGLKNVLNPLTFVDADAPVTLEAEPNHSAEAAQPIALPTIVSGRFDRPGDGDWYTFKGKANDVWSVDVLCERLDFPGDPFVIFFDSKGNELTTLDDHGINRGSLAQFNRDPHGAFRVPADGDYRIFVQERYRNGGPRYQYLLRLTKAALDFYPVVHHETPNEPTCPVVRQGGSAFYQVCLNRRDANLHVTIEAEGLPPGVKCPPLHISPQGQAGVLVFTAAQDAPAWSGAVRLKAWAMVDGKRIERTVRCSQRRYPIDNISTSIAVRHICLAVREQAPYAVVLPEKQLEVEAGAAAEFTATGHRYWADFKGPVELTGLDLPPGFSFPNVTIAADKTTAPCKLNVAANVPPGLYTLVLRGDAQVPFNRDAKATSRPNVRVADPSTPLTVRVTAAKKK